MLLVENRIGSSYTNYYFILSFAYPLQAPLQWTKAFIFGLWL